MEWIGLSQPGPQAGRPGSCWGPLTSSRCRGLLSPRPQLYAEPPLHVVSGVTPTGSFECDGSGWITAGAGNQEYQVDQHDGPPPSSTHVSYALRSRHTGVCSRVTTAVGLPGELRANAI